MVKTDLDLGRCTVRSEGFNVLPVVRMQGQFLEPKRAG
jgi:hypothetical protein